MQLDQLDIDFGVESKLHPCSQELQTDLLHYLIHVQQFPDTPLLQQQVKLTIFIGRQFADVALCEKLRWINRLLAVWLIFSDASQEYDVSCLADVQQLDLHAVELIPDSGFCSSVVAVLRDIMRFLRENSPEWWYNLFEKAQYESLTAHLHAAHKCQNLNTYVQLTNVQIFVFFEQPMMYLWEFLHDTYFSSIVRNGGFLRYIHEFSVTILTNYNEYILSQVEIGIGTAQGVMLTLKGAEGMSPDTAMCVMKAIIEDKMQELRDLVAMIEQLYSGEDLRALTLYVKQVFGYIQANKDYVVYQLKQYVNF